jgi:hypothetical protein
MPPRLDLTGHKRKIAESGIGKRGIPQAGNEWPNCDNFAGLQPASTALGPARVYTAAKFMEIDGQEQAAVG